MLPDLIEIVPPSRRTDATVVLPGSKSLTNRALVLAALASNPVVLRGALWSEDTQAMVNCLKRLGFRIEVADDPSEPANRTLTVYGCGGGVPQTRTPAPAPELFVGDAGAAGRLFPPPLCVGPGGSPLRAGPRP